MSATVFDLRVLVREVCDGSDSADPAMLAKEIHRRIKPADRDDALSQSLRSYVQHFVSRARHSPGSQRECAAQVSPAAGGHSSWKVTGIKLAWRRMLRDRIAVGADPDDWKFLSACTVADLTYAAEIREAHARRNTARAAQLRLLSDLLVEHEVTTVGELPDHVLGPALGEDEE